MMEKMKRKETLEKREKRRNEGPGGSLEASIADMLDFIEENSVAVAGTLIGLIIALAFILPINKRIPPKPSTSTTSTTGSAAAASSSPSSSTAPTTTSFTLTSSTSSASEAQGKSEASKQPNGNGDEKK